MQRRQQLTTPFLAFLLVALLATCAAVSVLPTTAAAQQTSSPEPEADRAEDSQEDLDGEADDEEDDEEFDAELQLAELRATLVEIQDELRAARADGSQAQLRLLEARRRQLEVERQLLMQISESRRSVAQADAAGDDDRAEELQQIAAEQTEQWEEARELHELKLGLLELDVIAEEATKNGQHKALARIEQLRRDQSELLAALHQLFQAGDEEGSTDPAAEQEEIRIGDLEEKIEQLFEDVEAHWEDLEYVLEHNADPPYEAELQREVGLPPNAVGAWSPTEAPTWTFAELKNSISQYCADCHAGEAPEANLDLMELLTHQPLVRDRDSWRRVMQLLEMGAMPPEDMTQPSRAERLGLLAALDREINQFDYSQLDDPGFEPARRLTHEQYNQTVRDLLGVDLRPAERFPSELAGASGFDNSANTLVLQPALMERYIGAAERIVELALPAQATTAAHRKTRELIFVASPSTDGEQEAARRIFRRFLTRAYRRPATSAELQGILALYRQQRQSGANFDESIRSVLPAVLISPKFLLRIEAGQDTDQAYRISDWELASRLSYFLWASMPDDELFELARQDKLHQPQVLDKQVTRMLADPRANSLGDTFAAQWLSTRLIGTRIRLDPIDNPWCTDSLMSAMRRETSLFFVSLLRENRSLSELIDADYTYLNEELARTLYGRDDITGAQMRRVSLTDPNRGGILTQPSILTVTSSYRRTSPIKRGIYVLDTVLGTPPPPPPPNASELDEELEENRRLSFREKLALHSKNATCHACHATIDPMGFALENFDYFGRWRETYRRRRPIDASATLPDGTEFAGPAGLKRVILDKRFEDFSRQVVAKVLAYALGRPLDYYDEPALQSILAELAQNDFRFQTLLKEVVKSYPFQYRKNPTAEQSS